MQIKTITKIITALILLISIKAYSQTENAPNIQSTSITESDSGKLFLSVNNANFLKNNEYFSPIVQGYTLIGYFLAPRLQYNPSQNIKIEAGLHLLKYSGLDNFSDVHPTFTIQYKIFENLDIVFGTLYGTLHHQLPEPVFSFENYYTDNLENGLQFLFNTNYFKADIWLDWEQFIFEQDTIQERLTFGISSRLFLTNPESKFTISTPFQVLVAHRGGQINSTNANIETLANIVTGICLKYRFENSYLKDIALKSYYLKYLNSSPVKQTFYNSGQAFYPNVIINGQNAYLNLGYWDGYRFFAPKGEPIFGSISTYDLTRSQPHRKLFTGKLVWGKEVFRNIKLEARFESYYDLKRSNFDYAFGVNFLFYEKFFLKDL